MNFLNLKKFKDQGKLVFVCLFVLNVLPFNVLLYFSTLLGLFDPKLYI